MPWFYVDDAFADSKPVMQLDATIRNEAVGLWVRCGAWSAKEETDGHVPLDVVRSFGGTPRLIRALINIARLWSPGGDFDENLTEFPPDSWRKTGEILFRNWPKWQRTREELMAKRHEAAERQRRCRENRKPKGRNAVTSTNDDMSRVTEGVTNSVSHSVTDQASHTVTANPVTRDKGCDASRARARRPDPTQPIVVTLGGEGYVTNGHEPDTPPPRFCPKHMPHGTDDDCGACGAHRRRHLDHLAEQSRKASEAARARAQAERDAVLSAKRQAMVNCPLGCFERDGYTRSGAVCHHKEHSTPEAREAARKAVAEAVTKGKR